MIGIDVAHTPPAASTPTAPPNAETLFDDYAEAVNQSLPEKGPGSRGRLSTNTRYLYRLIWLSYCKHLAGLPGRVLWHQATPDDVRSFLASVSPRSRRETRANSTDPTPRQTSTVSQQRYETILHRIYHYALSLPNSPIPLNPVRLTRIPNTPKREAADSFLLHAGYRAKLLAHISTTAEGWAARDAAMLALMAAQGLTPAELIALQAEDVEWANATPSIHWIQQHAPWPDAPHPLALHVPAVARDAQQRRLELDPLSSTTLRQWLRYRGNHLGQTHRNKGLQSCLFLSNKGMLSTNRVYEVANQHIMQTLVDGPDGPGSGDTPRLVHAGPMALRTAALLNWLEHIDDIREVLRRSGLAEIKSLARIKAHASPIAAARYDTALTAALAIAPDPFLPPHPQTAPQKRA